MTQYVKEIQIGNTVYPIKAAGDGMPIGTIYSVNCTASYIPNGALPCDGTEYNKSQFSDLWTNYLNTVSPATEPLLKTCSYADYATAITTYGQCPMFAVDAANNTFKTPTIKDGSYITQALTDGELGKSYNESLPNITGRFTTGMATSATGAQNGIIRSATGAMSPGPETGTRAYFTKAGDTTTSYNYSLDFDASGSSSTYQNGAKVQGNNVRLRYFIQVATGQINQSQMDWSAWASSLSGKVSKTGDTMTGELQYNAQNLDISTTPASNAYAGIQINDINGNRISKLESAQLDNGRYRTSLSVVRDVSGTTKYGSLSIDIDSSGKMSAWKGSQEILVNSMPSSTYTDLTLGSTGSSYTAPANGWVVVAKKNTALAQNIAIVKFGKTFSETSAAVSTNDSLFANAPMYEGESFKINYSAGGETLLFRFYYAKGDV